MKSPSKILSAVAFAAAIGWAGVAHSAVMQTFTALPTPNCGLAQTNNCIQFGDFSVYSLALLAAQTNYANTGNFLIPPFNTQDPYYVKSTPGELGIDGYIVYGTAPGNLGVTVNGDGTLIDNAQNQPTGAGSHPPFVVDATTETTPTFPGDLNTSWDGTLSAIRTELGAGSTSGGQFVIYFNLNETGTNGLDGIDLLTWFHVTLHDSDGILADKNYYLYGGNPNGIGTATAGATPNIADNTDPNWVYVHGTICVSPSAGFLHFGPCTATEKTDLKASDVNQNLGADNAAFAVFNQELSNLVLNSGYDIIRGNWQFSNIDNGFEQQFSALAPFQQTIPEPGSLLLLGLGLAALTLVRSGKGCGSV